jgi:DNA-directed RNA polymerase subunit RPC12/RpoP
VPQQFGDLIASELYCPRCGRSMRVRERLLLVLPSGELHEYICSGCSSSLGQRNVTAPKRTASTPHNPATRPRQLFR